MKKIIVLSITMFFGTFTTAAFSESQFEKDVKNIRSITEKQEKERARKLMKDKRHDNRYKLNGNTSISPTANPVGADIKITY